MKDNYSNYLEDLLDKLEHKPTLLLHSCCAPCSSYVIDYLRGYFDITILYYNPNISPYEEYVKRKEEQKRLLREMTGDMVKFLDSDYDNDTYEAMIQGLEKEPERGRRCTKCFMLRLEKTAKMAMFGEYEFFGTTLTVSPYKNASLLNELGKELEQKYGVTWLISDFKKKDGYKKSILLAQEYNLYRQDYCGCIYSKRDT